ncbi:MAG: hypothetical protein H7Y27_01495 [Gemmatimonadaceae bacterium]|nr:hypothetical protein [Chitinophagaceae bacterium]
MGKSKSSKTKKSAKPAAPASGMVVKNSQSKSGGKPSSFLPNKSFSSSKKGSGQVSAPRKAS